MKMMAEEEVVEGSENIGCLIVLVKELEVWV
jgi:hypothetical protein